MEFYKVVNRRRSIRQFEEREIPREVLERILDAGLKSPLLQSSEKMGAGNAYR
ncbi:nitroreductase family protein [Agathobaculum sp. NTUH-O15-33]|uniref:nitroreductase family protein n=1 Tax=Agathobaculum sp. NTUH-O15-33 TaxID=3079302 RepID=UPI0029584BCC|nr:nitroreductase family protein [Agathobaculum sp. NTUH-O15-33]WNX86217.1 nitroreductase family protein [Agathobaculum sp. NTUH-O15-33]